MDLGHDRNIAESVTILALAFRAGLASRDGDQITVEPADLESDRHRGFDLILRRNNRWLLVDVTSSRRYKGGKVQRAVGHAKRGGRWVYILKVDWLAATETALDPCFDRVYSRLIDGEPIALEEACPKHGNKCTIARKLFEFGGRVNQTLVNSPTEAKNFSMEVIRPPF
ncbi:MAG: hypothetical protein BMS9Abin34_267 [Patescibacteria group bacterium]|nr:MAG: hypothetical protein BMS9Abin34_267 [Patescibacteria group bacterium]